MPAGSHAVSWFFSGEVSLSIFKMWKGYLCVVSLFQTPLPLITDTTREGWLMVDGIHTPGGRCVHCDTGGVINLIPTAPSSNKDSFGGTIIQHWCRA
jgi:hypothetical protein